MLRFILDSAGTRQINSPILQKVGMPLISHNSCTQKWSNQISKSMICAFQRGVGACQV